MPKQAMTTPEFLNQHPFCCFCGGVVPATTRDHVPPKISFIDKAWPDGFEFPACEPCNASTRLLDQEFAMLGSFGGLEKDLPHGRVAHFAKVFQAVANNNMELALGLSMSANDKRNAMDALGQPLMRGSTYKEFPIVNLTDRARLALQTISFKIGCALHYKHLGEPLPETGKVVSGHRTNFTILTKGGLRGMEENTSLAVIPKRNGQDLSSQFAYRVGVHRKNRIGLFVCKFRDSFQLEIMTFATPPAYRADIGDIPEVRDYLKNLKQ